MGFNFIYSQAKAHTKAWNESFNLAATNLFSLPANRIERTFIAKTSNCASFSVGERVLVRRKDAGIAVYRGVAPVATADLPSLAIGEMVDQGHGVIEGEVTDVVEQAKVLMIKVVEGPSDD